MKTPAEIIRAVTLAGGRLEPVGDKLRVLLPVDCSPALMDVIRQNKDALLNLLEDQVTIAPDCTPWLHVARQILGGEFVGADGSTRESLTIGLRGIENPLCRRALAVLNTRGMGTGTI